MANQYLAVSNNNLYSSGYLLTLPDGRGLLKRSKYVYSPTGAKDINHIVKDTDTIWSIAFKYYKDPKRWGIIADANNLYNPMELTVGQGLIIPELEKIKLQS